MRQHADPPKGRVGRWGGRWPQGGPDVNEELEQPLGPILGDSRGDDFPYEAVSMGHRKEGQIESSIKSDGDSMNFKTNHDKPT